MKWASSNLCKGWIPLKNSITIPEAAGGLQEESATGFGRKADFSVRGGPSELAMATRGAICLA